MDPVTHLVITRLCVGAERSVLISGVVADLPFYATYPLWVIWRGELRSSLRQSTWPDAPAWMVLPHHITHSLPLVALLGVLERQYTGAWPRWCTAWLLHILIDIPTHSRRS